MAADHSPFIEWQIKNTRAITARSLELLRQLVEPDTFLGRNTQELQMLLKLSDKISECLEKAADARERANAAIDPARKADELDLELRWLQLVESYRFVEQVTRFLADARERQSPPIQILEAANGALLAQSLDALARTAKDRADGEARAAFYISDAGGTELRHVTGMSPAYAKCVDGFKIGPQSLACGLAAARRQAVLTPDVTKDPLWKEWLWLAREFDYRAC